MENASRALIIAGGMLIAMLIVGLMVFGYSRIRAFKEEEKTAEEREEIVEFNQRFEAYNRTTVRGFQMISLANLVYDTNQRFSEYDGYTPVTIYVDGLSDSNSKNDNLEQYIQNNYERMNLNEKNALKQSYFQCTDVKYDSRNSRVVSMHFEKVEVISR